MHLEVCHVIPGFDPSVEAYPNHNTHCRADEAEYKYGCQVDGADEVIVQLSQGLVSSVEPHLIGLSEIAVVHILPLLFVSPFLRILMPITVSSRDCPNR